MIGSVSVGGQATDTFSALLKVISDPEKHKVALADLKKQADEAQAATAALRTAQAETAAKRDEAEKALAAKHDEVTKAIADLEAKRRAHAVALADYDSRKTRLFSEAATLEARKAKIDKAERELDDRAAQHGADSEKLSVALTAREQRVSDREAALGEREAALAAGEADFAGRMGALRKLAG